jgi:hypothetical protein
MSAMDWSSLILLLILVAGLSMAIRHAGMQRDVPRLPDRTRIEEINKRIQEPEFLEDLSSMLDAAEIEVLLSIPLSSPEDDRRLRYLVKKLGVKRTMYLLSRHKDQSWN